MSEQQEPLLPTTTPPSPDASPKEPRRSCIDYLPKWLCIAILIPIFIIIIGLTFVTTYILFPLCVAIALRRLLNPALICTRWDRILSIALVIISCLEVVVVAFDARDLWTGKRAWDNGTDSAGKRFYRGWLFLRDFSVAIVYILEGLSGAWYVRRMDAFVWWLDKERRESLAEKEGVDSDEEKKTGGDQDVRDVEKGEVVVDEKSAPSEV